MTRRADVPLVRRLGLPVMAFFVLVVLAGCQSTSTPGPALGVSQSERIDRHRRRVESFDEFRVRGGIGIWNDAESMSVRMTWQERPGSRAISLRGPAGIGSLQLDTQANGPARLRVGQRPEQIGATADGLLRQVLGLTTTIPLDQLSLWIRGLPGTASSLVYDDDGRLQSLRWSDPQGSRWSANIKRYDDVESVSLPSLVTAQGAGYRMRIVLKDWQRAPESGEEIQRPDTPNEPGDTELPTAPERLRIPGRQG